jgi:AraC-like DNA-binding protein
MSKSKMEVEKRHQKALKLRSEGYSIREIGKLIGLSSPSSVQFLLRRNAITCEVKGCHLHPTQATDLSSEPQSPAKASPKKGNVS